MLFFVLTLLVFAGPQGPSPGLARRDPSPGRPPLLLNADAAVFRDLTAPLGAGRGEADSG